MNASAKFFDASMPAAFAGKDAGSKPAFRWYDKDRVVHGRRLEDHLRFAVCYWHSFCWPGGDPFGGETFLRPWHHGSDPMAMARAKADVAFELFRLLDVPFFTFHDVDAAPEAGLEHVPALGPRMNFLVRFRRLRGAPIRQHVHAHEAEHVRERVDQDQHVHR